MKKIIAMAVVMLPFASTAQTFNELWHKRAIASFEEVWRDRVESEVQIKPAIEAAQPFDEEQYQHDKKIAAEEAAKKPKPKKKKEDDDDDDCLTLRQARKKYPHSRHYYWEDNHCWFGLRKGERL